ncbi:Ammonium transporter 3, putative [Brugia malayi]|uniref:Ammonium transporter n=1 Tax=Brugia malayi TaxID=6279 RepID=A0A4E9FB49_BRUMA|nr:Ammonium transporter 3, putative [Brugia malayi]VIO93267.1 Ammonium transporter 3, putative [Brugia malayi]
MHSGFGLLESGSVAAKDEVNIMVKNVVDVVFGGLAYWAFGYGLSFGNGPYSNAITGWGKFFYNPQRDFDSPRDEGWAYANFLFQLSFATTSSTIVSGAVAERAKLRSYILLGCIVILIQALPSHWVWDSQGVFFKLGVVDFAGCSCIHMVGGIIGLVATIYLKPRRNRFNENSVHQMSSPTNALLGTFMLWWGWFGINSGSAWGVTNGRWRLAARASVATIMSSIGGGVTSITFSFAKTRKLQVNYLIFGLLSSVVAITAICAVARPWHALLIGAISSTISISVIPALEFLKIDDPVGIIPIHLTSSIWGMCAVGIFAEDDQVLAVTSGHYGLIYSGSFKLLAIQMLCTITILVYSAIAGLLALIILGKSPLGIRVTDYEEQIGADVVEHGLAGTNIARYHLEKPLSSKTFATVTKAITKWKIQTRTNRALRQQNAALGYRQESDSGTMLMRQRKNKLSNGAFFSLSHHIRSRNSPSRTKTSTTPAISLSSNFSKETNRRSMPPFRKKEDNVKCVKINEIAAFTSKRRMEEEDEKNPNCSKRTQSNFVPMLDRFSNNISGTLKSLNPDQLRLDVSSGSAQEAGRSLDHNIVSERRVLQYVTPNIDSGSATRIVTSATSCRNKILPLISDAV